MPQKKSEKQMRELTHSKPLGRPKADIDPSRVESMAMAGCSVAMIAAAFHVEPITIYRNFGDTIQRGQLIGDNMILRAAFELAVVRKEWPAIKFLLENRIGMRAPAQPVTNNFVTQNVTAQNVQINQVELSHMTEEQLDARIKELRAKIPQAEIPNDGAGRSPEDTGKLLQG